MKNGRLARRADCFSLTFQGDLVLYAGSNLKVLSLAGWAVKNKRSGENLLEVWPLPVFPRGSHKPPLAVVLRKSRSTNYTRYLLKLIERSDYWSWCSRNFQQEKAENSELNSE
jgi:hypothetical protein